MWQMVGQSRAIYLLQRSLEKGSLAHAYLITGPPHVGKMTLAINLAQVLNCEATEPPCGACPSCQKIDQGKHADVQIIGLSSINDTDWARRRTEISIDQIRQLQRSASLPPFEGRYKVFIIDGAELLSTEAANCLLKTLEEPVGQVVFVLLTANSSLLPETVVSRCQRLELLPVAAGEVETALITRWDVEPQKARLLARLSHGCFGWALSAVLGADLLTQYYERRDRLLDIINSDREERFNYAAQLATQFGQERGSVQGVLALWLDFWRDLLLIRVGFSQAITNIDLEDTLAKWASGFSPAEVRAFISSIQAARKQLGQNANPRLVLEVLMLDMPRRKMEGVTR
jgi:DNA polymerase-3 subunit delta'